MKTSNIQEKHKIYLNKLLKLMKVLIISFSKTIIKIQKVKELFAVFYIIL